MRTLHFGLRVADVDRSLAFYTAVGYEVVGSVPETSLGELTMLKLPEDEFVTIELVHDPTQGDRDVGTGLSHSPGGRRRGTPPGGPLRDKKKSPTYTLAAPGGERFTRGDP